MMTQTEQIALEDRPVCTHEHVELRKRIQANGVEVLTRQCLRCGASRGCVPKKSVPVHEYTKLRDWDNVLTDSWQSKVRQYYDRWRENWQRQQADKDAEFWDRYKAHLASPKWASLRRRVLERCQGICEGCGINRAAHVHHLTYDRLGAEMLFDLVGVCIPCHEAIHGKKIGGPCE